MLVSLITIVVGAVRAVPKELEKKWSNRKLDEELKPSKSQHFKICQNFLKIPRDLKRLTVSQNPVKCHLLML